MFRFTVLGGLLTLVCAHPTIAQPPTPPRLLPPGVTGTPPTTNVQPVKSDQQQPAAPMARFLAKPQDFPIDTISAVDGVILGADWLYRRNQAGGRFASGLNPTLRQWVDDGFDPVRQAFAVRGYLAAAKFTGDDRHTARAAACVLGLLTLTKADADGTRWVTIPADRSNRAMLAALIVLCISEMPDAGAEHFAQADAITTRLMKCVETNGSIKTEEASDLPSAFSLERKDAASGFVLQALLAQYRRKQDPALRELLPKIIAATTQEATAKKSIARRATTIPALVDYAMMTNKDPKLCALVFELTDQLLMLQIPASELRRGNWIGGFSIQNEEPNMDAALALVALSRAAYLTRQVPDLARFEKYRQAAMQTVKFTKSLQLTDESTDHFNAAFRVEYLRGGVRPAVTDGTIRADATGLALYGWVQYLTQGTERE